jgi:hypothetical protein
MIDDEVLAELKKKNGPLFAFNIKGTDLLFRQLTFEQFDDIAQGQESGYLSSADAEDKVLEATLVYPDINFIQRIPAGAVSSIAQEIIDQSGLASARIAKGILEEKRAISQTDVRVLMKAFVLATMPAYSPDDLNKMTFSQLAEKVALAERIIEIKQTMNGLQPSQMKLDLIDPEEEINKEKARAANYNASRVEGEAVYEDPIARKLWGSM